MTISRRQFLKGTVVAAPAIIVASHLMNVWTKPQPEIFTGFDVANPFDYQVGMSHGLGPNQSPYLSGMAKHGEVVMMEGGTWWMFNGPDHQWRKLWV